MSELTIEQTFEAARALHQAGRLEEAEALYRQVLASQPDHADALHLLGMMAGQRGQAETAIELIGRAIAIDPTVADYHNNMGNALREKGKFDDAIASFRRALTLNPEYAQALVNLGNTLAGTYQLDEAIKAYDAALRIKPNYPKAYINLGLALRENEQLDQAILAFREALRMEPNWADAHGILGNTLREQGNLDQALAECRRAILLAPAQPDGYFQLGAVLGDKGLHDEAIGAFRQAIQLKPDHALARWNLGRQLLLLGDFTEGWAELEWRRKWRDYSSLRPDLTQPQWNGEELNGRTVLIHADREFNDAIQFIRYAPMIAARGGRVIFQCPSGLARLLQNAPGVEQMIIDEPLPAYDLHCPVLSLPLAFKTTLESIPAPIPYLKASTAIAQTWGRALGSATEHLRVGLAWADDSIGSRRNRSMDLAQLAPLARVSAVKFYSLQTGEPASQAANPPAGMELTDLTKNVQDLADIAGLISHLDLVITVDSAVAHVAGAMGKPVWPMLPFVPDWRWMLDRQESPWYPTMRLFRQKSLGNWSEVVGRVAGFLAGILAQHAGPR